MQLTNMFKKTKGRENVRSLARTSVPDGLLRKCNKCAEAVLVEDVRENDNICPHCNGYFRVHARRRIVMLTDADSFVEWDESLSGGNPLDYKGYEEKKEALLEKTGLREAIITGKAKIEGQETVIGVMDGRFLMASMGQAVGEKITCAVERATKECLPVVLVACSGGARMQEGIISLMQMAKTAAAFKRHSDSGNFYVSVLTDPTTGGVTASFAMLGDVILAEPQALIGFAGPRVIEQTIGQKLPKGFQRAEFLKEHGFIDEIVPRKKLKSVLGSLLRLHQMKEWKEKEAKPGKSNELLNQLANPWDRVLMSRMKDRPVGEDYIRGLFDGFLEMHGDRYYGDDTAIIGGIGEFFGHPVTVIVQAKGRDTKENISRNFGMPSPEGYRKALRLMKQAEKFNRPIICFVDTPGAFCGLEAEERGQGEAIARNLYEMSSMTVPILSIVIGEGGSGGALAQATANEVWMLENSIYSILSPEGFASILWKDSAKAQEAAEVMKLTSKDLYELKVVDRIIEEPGHLTLQNLNGVLDNLRVSIQDFLNRYCKMTREELAWQRYNRFRNM